MHQILSLYLQLLQFFPPSWTPFFAFPKFKGEEPLALPVAFRACRVENRVGKKIKGLNLYLLEFSTIQLLCLMVLRVWQSPVRPDFSGGIARPQGQSRKHRSQKTCLDWMEQFSLKYAKICKISGEGSNRTIEQSIQSTQRSLGVDNISVWVPSACTACSAGTKRGQRWKRPSLPNLRLRRWCLSACCQLGMEPETFKEMSAAMLTQYYCDSYIYIYIYYIKNYILYIKY